MNVTMNHLELSTAVSVDPLYSDTTSYASSWTYCQGRRREKYHHLLTADVGMQASFFKDNQWRQCLLRRGFLWQRRNSGGQMLPYHSQGCGSRSIRIHAEVDTVTIGCLKKTSLNESHSIFFRALTLYIYFTYILI